MEKGSVLLITSEYPPGPGGIGTHAFQLSKQLHALGWKMHVVASQDYVTEGEVNEFNSRLPFPVTFRQSRGSFITRMWRSFKNIISAYKKGRPDVIITTGDAPTFFILGLNSFFKKPWIIVEHGSIGQGVLARVKRKSTRAADLVIYVSHYTKNHIEKHVKAEARDFRVIPNGGDEDIFHQLPVSRIAEFRKQFQPGNPILLTVGNVTHRKGQEVTIRALPEVKKHFPDILYVMAGKSTLKDELNTLAKELGVEQNIRFWGIATVRELVQLYNTADLFLMTSRLFESNNEIEGFGIAVIEAALCGRAAVVSDNSGLKEAVVDGVTGLVAGENDPQSTAAAIITILGDANLKQKMEAAALQRAKESLTWRKVALEYETSLKKVIGKQ
jgi:phosphatidyl-myo-inositol dimannoside synthase